MATALHFFPYYFVHGKSMIYLGLICAINVFVGYVYVDVPLEVIAYIDAAIKLMFGFYLLFLSKPSKANLRQFFGGNKAERPRHAHTHPGPPARKGIITDDEPTTVSAGASCWV